MMGWVAFSEQCSELEEWLDVVHSKLSETVLQNTLQEKKDRLQLLKVIIVLWHFPVYFFVHHLCLEVESD